jgi:integrase
VSLPVRKRLEPGIFERVNPAGGRLGLEIVYKDADGKTRRRSVQGDIHDARDQLAAARTRRTRREVEPANPRMTFNAVCDEFERTHLASLRPNSQGVRRAALKRLRAAFGPKRISQISRADVRRFVNDLAADRKANTVLAYYSTLRAVYGFAASDVDIPVTFPRLKPSELPDPVDDAREHRVLADDELANALESCDPAFRLYFRTLAETGCRASEALGLIPGRVGDGTIRFSHQLGKGEDRSLRPLKSRHSNRTIEARRALTAELRLAAAGDRVFAPMTLKAVERAWADALNRAGLADPQPVVHDLRHTHASKLIAAGWDPVEVAKRLGDRVETILAVYAHEFDARRRSAERRAMLDAMYGEMATEMATHTPLQTATDGAKVQSIRTHRNTVR